jgi:hypothetical protein
MRQPKINESQKQNADECEVERNNEEKAAEYVDDFLKHGPAGGASSGPPEGED